MGVELRQLTGQDVFRRLDVSEVPADQVDDQLVSIPGSKDTSLRSLGGRAESSARMPFLACCKPSRS